MHGPDDITVILIVIAVLLFMGLGIAMVVIIDHKAKIPDSFHSDPFSIRGMRRDHPVIGFLTTTILGLIILALMAELAVALGERFGLFAEKEEPKLLQKLSEQRFTEKMRHFHNEPVEDRVNLGAKQVCFHCHGDYPHSKQRMVRTLLNMHTQFVGCMTCHNDPGKFDEDKLTFQWLNFSGIEVSGAPFGTSIDPDTGYLVETDDLYSKIVAYDNSSGTPQLLEITENLPEVQEFLEVKEQLSDKDRDAVKKSFHKTVSSKGRFCSRCHTRESESYLPFRQLGFSEHRIGDITNLNIVGIVQKYRQFYMPNLLKSDVPLPDASALVGPAGKSEASGDDKKGKEAWWR